jgi:hypothetical protein
MSQEAANDSYENSWKVAQTTNKKEDYLKAWVLRPWKAEPLAKVASQLLDETKYREACVLAQLGMTLPVPDDAKIEFRRILSIGSYFTSNHKEGLEQAEFLHFSKQSRYRLSLAHNNIFYAKKLNLSSKFELKIESETYHPMNPSLCKNGDKVYVNVRTVNYRINNSGGYHWDDNSNKNKTNNYLLAFTDKLESCGKPIKLQDKCLDTSKIQGIEDIRLYQITSTDIFGYGVRWDCGSKNATMYNLQWSKSGELLKQTPLSDGNQCEKNWLPFLDQGVLKHIYSHNPFTIASPDNDVPLVKQEQDLDLSHFRGGASPIWFKDRWLWIVHEVFAMPGETKRKYYHRWVWSDKDFKEIEFSKPFILEKPQIEFIAGLAKLGDDVLIGYGIEDKEAWLGVVPEKEVDSYLE